MKLKATRLLAGVTAGAAGLAGVVVTGGVSAAAPPDRANNVIYMVGDGMGVTHRNAARLRYAGAAGELEMDKLPVSGMVSTYAVEERSATPDYVTDSASSGTAWSSGVKTYNNALGKDAFGKVVPTVMEEAKAAGMRTGNVTTSEITDATPAAMMSHVSRRGCQGPSSQMTTPACLQDPGAGGRDVPVAQQIARNGTADVIFGGGLARFEPADQVEMEKNGYTVLGSFGETATPAATLAANQRVATEDDLKAATSGKVIGLFNRGNLTVEKFKRQNASTVQAKEPTLAEMTAKAIELLSLPAKAGKSGADASNDKKPGFLLQVEGALIDKRSHANDAAQTLEEMKAFDDAVAVAVAFAKRSGDTLVVVTADHECAGFNIIGKGSFTNAEAASPPGNVDGAAPPLPGNPANNSTPSRSSRQALDPNRSKAGGLAPLFANTEGSPANNFAPATFRTVDDPQGVQDGTANASLWLSYLSGNHTGADVPLTATGPGSEQFDGLQDNTQHYGFMKNALGLR